MIWLPRGGLTLSKEQMRVGWGESEGSGGYEGGETGMQKIKNEKIVCTSKK